MAEEIEEELRDTAQGNGSSEEPAQQRFFIDDYQILSTGFWVRSIDEGFAEALRWHLAPFWRPEPANRAYPVDLYIAEEDLKREPAPYSLLVAGSLKYRYHELEEILAEALWQVHAAVTNFARDFLFIHAGAVVRKGGALFTPARMDAGKSSLVVALLEKGFEYLSDEYGTIDPITERAYPFERLLRLEPDALRFFPGVEERLHDRHGLTAGLKQRFIRPQDLAASVAAPTPVRWLVFPESIWEGPPRLIPVSSAEAVDGLAANCFNLGVYGNRGLVLLSRIVKGAQAFRLEGGTPRERAALLAERLE